MEDVERLEPGVDRLGALEVEHGRDAGTVELGRGAGETQPAARRALDPEQQGGLPEHLGERRLARDRRR